MVKNLFKWRVAFSHAFPDNGSDVCYLLSGTDIAAFETLKHFAYIGDCSFLSTSSNYHTFLQFEWSYIMLKLSFIISQTKKCIKSYDIFLAITPKITQIRMQHLCFGLFKVNFKITLVYIVVSNSCICLIAHLHSLFVSLGSS